MPTVRAFRGIRYSATSDLGELVCPPFDVISNEEQQRLYERSPYNAVRLELAQKDDTSGYGVVASTFRTWLEEGVLSADPGERLYVYRQDFVAPDGGETRRRVAGVLGALELEPFGQKSGVLPHERTMAGPKEDRLALLRACPVNFSPIYAIYRGGGGVAPYFDSLEHRPVAARLVGDEQILHRLWVIDAPAEIAMLQAALAPGPLVIADGHHRYETSLAFQQERPDLPEGDTIMCFCVDADNEGLVVLPYHRLIQAQEDEETIAARARRNFGARPLPWEEMQDAIERSQAAHAFVIVLPSEALLVELDRDEVERALPRQAEAWRDLSVVALHEIVLPQLFPDGITELTFTRDANELRNAVGEGRAAAGVMVTAVQPAEIVDVAASGERMPQKASYFWPKAITGLVFHPLG